MTPRPTPGPGRRTLRVAATTAGVLGGGALTGLAALGGALGVQSAAVRRRVLVDPRTAPDLGGVVGTGEPTLRMLVLGDSTAVGVGVTRAQGTAAGRVAAALVRAGHTVTVTSVAVPGSHTADVRMQVSRALVTSEDHPHDLALVLVGAGDAISWVASGDVARSLSRAVQALRHVGTDVVVGTCLDLGASRCTGFPLREVWGRRSRRIAAAQEAAAADAGAHVVNLAERLGPIFRADPGALAPDGFHPSADGYRLIAEALSPAVSAAVGRPSGTPS